MSGTNSSNDSLLGMDRLEVIEKELGELSTRLTGFILNNKLLKKRVSELTEENNEIYDKLFDLEKYIADINQYSRRNNVKFRNIPETITSKDLEIYIIKLLGSIGVKVESYNIVAVHRLGRFNQNKNRNVIVRFLNRKMSYSCLDNSKKLSESSNTI